jgi:hypothetical protein
MTEEEGFDSGVDIHAEKRLQTLGWRAYEETLQFPLQAREPCQGQFGSLERTSLAGQRLQQASLTPKALQDFC